MSNDIKNILDRLALVEGKTVPVSPKGSMTAQQERVPQLPALFKPKNISTTLTKKPYQKHPMDGYMVGETALSDADDLRAKLKALQDLEREPGHDKEAVRQRKLDLDKEARQKGLSEAMQEVEEDMLSKVKRDLTHYLDKLEQKVKIDRELKDKAVSAVERGEAEEGIEEDDVEDFDNMQQGIKNTAVLGLFGAGMLETASPVKTYNMEDGSCLECYGNDDDGYEVRHNGRSLPTKFPKLNHADMAVKLFQKRRAPQNPKQSQDLSQDYIEEK